MSISFELPIDLEQHLRQEMADLDLVAKEAALVELYRRENITHHELATALGLDRFETEELLKRHNVVEDLITLAEFEEQLEVVRKLTGE